MPSDCCYFVVKAAAADAAPAFNYFSSILHRSAVFTQNLGQNRVRLSIDLILALLHNQSKILSAPPTPKATSTSAEIHKIILDCLTVIPGIAVNRDPRYQIIAVISQNK